ncbi:MAG: hypothetical protein N3C12_07500 [Candidatus Binatia bacterium]|nr:hypothetical protein [Candidatus Binatia bacterium]
MKEAPHTSPRNHSSKFLSVSILCPLLPPGEVPRDLARLLDVLSPWTEKRGHFVELIVVDEGSRTTEQSKTKTLGPVKLIRRGLREHWGEFLARTVSSAKGDWIVVAGTPALEHAHYLDSILHTLDFARQPIVGVVSDRLGTACQFGGDQLNPRDRTIAAFAAPKAVAYRAAKQLPGMAPQVLLASWWNAIVAAQRNPDGENQVILVALPEWVPIVEPRQTTNSGANLTVPSTGSLNPAGHRAVRDIRILTAVTLLAALTSLLVSGRFAYAASWLGGCSGFSAFSLWALQKLVLPILARVSVALKFSASALAPPLRVAAWLYLSGAVVLALVTFGSGLDLRALGIEALVLALASAVMVIGIHLLSWSGILEALTDSRNGT